MCAKNKDVDEINKRYFENNHNEIMEFKQNIRYTRVLQRTRARAYVNEEMRKLIVKKLMDYQHQIVQ